LETTFSWPGLGYAFAQAASTLDIPLVEGITIVITVMVMIANLMTDLVYAMIDPRVTVQ
jgi:peptide/nickel transport system permease protein